MTKKKSCAKLQNFYQNYVNFLQNHLASVLLLSMRILIGLVFLKSGLTKISNVDQTITLFAYEYNVPLLPPSFAAISSIIFEIGCGTALIAGLFTRLAALPLIGMTLVIQFFVIQNDEHLFWLMLLSGLAIYGAGKLSIDHVLNKFCNCQKR